MNLAEQFPLEQGLIYLNHAAVSPWPRCSVEAIERFARENMHLGSSHYPQWLETEQALRGLLQRLINASSTDEIALVKNTSEALSLVAYGLDWKAGERVVIPAGEFPSNRMVWESLSRFGVELNQVELSACADPEQALIAALEPGTRLLAVSSVQYHNGLRLDLERLGRACRERGVLFCVDAIQSLGALQFDVQACQADFVAADGHKWMLGPEGLALLYCRQALLPQLKLHQYGWHMAEPLGDFEAQDWQPAATARRFECGSPNMLAIHALHASLGLLLSHGMAEVEQAVLERGAQIHDFLQAQQGEFECLSPTEEARRSGIVTFRPRHGRSSEALFQALGQRGIFCALRGGGIRFSPHFYTPPTQIEQALAQTLDLVHG